MNNVVVNIKYGGYLVKFPYQDTYNFFADTEEALIEGIEAFKSGYTPAVYRILQSYTTFKLKKVTAKELQLFKKNIETMKKFRSK